MKISIERDTFYFERSPNVHARNLMAANLLSLTQYSYVKELGKSRHGQTILSRLKTTNELYAIKMLILSFHDDTVRERFLQDVTDVQSFRHTCLLPLYGVALADSALVYHYEPLGSVADMIRNKDPKWTPTAMMINIYGVATALSFLHTKNIIHRNLTFENVLLDENYFPRVTGFGFLAVDTCLDEYRYASPEMYRNEEYTNKVDIYAFGLYVIELLTGTLIKPVQVPETFPKRLYQLIQRCILKEPAARPAFPEILSELSKDKISIPGTALSQFKSYRNTVDSKNAVPKPSPVHLPPLSNATRMKNSSQNTKPLVPQMKSDICKSSSRLPSLTANTTKPKGNQFFGPHIKTKLEILEEEAKTTKDPEICYKLAKLFEQGNQSVQPNYHKAVKYYKTASKKNYAAAQYRLGMMLYRGLGVAQNYMKALYFFRHGGKNGNGSAEYMYSIMLFNGMGIPKNIQKSLRHFKRAAHIGNPNAQYFYARLLEDGVYLPQDVTTAFHYFTKAADQGHPDAQFKAGKMLASGIATNKRFRKAVEYLRLSATQKHPAGLSGYAFMLENGLGISANLQLAAKFYKKAAKKSDPFGQNNYGRMLNEGIGGVQKDPRMAAEMFKAAADQNDPAAMNNYGRMLEYGRGVEQNLTEAYRYYQMASDQNETIGTVNLALMLETGKGCEKDVKRAVELFKIAADKNDPYGDYNYARCLEKGIGIKQNISESMYYYRLAANQGLLKAMHHLAVMFENGIGTKSNVAEALVYYQRAAQKGHEPSKQAVMRIQGNI